MSIFRRIQKLLRADQYAQQPVKSECSASLNIMKLEKRRLLNADFSMLAGLDLTLDNIDADVSLQESATDFEFILDGGTWNGTDVVGMISGDGTNTLNVNKAALNGLSNGVSLDANQASAVTFALDSNQEPLDLSAMAGPLTVSRFDTVTQSAAEVSVSDLIVNSAQQIRLTTLSGDTLWLEADEIDFLGGTDSITGSFATLSTTSIEYHIGGNGNSIGRLDITDSDIAAFANGFSNITIGVESSAATVTMRIDSSGADFGDDLILNVRNLNTPFVGDIHIDGDLTTTAHNDSATITLLGNNDANDPATTTYLNADLRTISGSINIQDSLLVNGPRVLDTTNQNSSAGADVDLAFEIAGANLGGSDELTIMSALNDADGIDDGAVRIGGVIQNPVIAPQNGIDLERLEITAGSTTVGDIESDVIDIASESIQLTGVNYVAEQFIALKGAVVATNSDGLALRATDLISIDGSVDSAANANVSLQADQVRVLAPIGSSFAPQDVVIQANETILNNVTSNRDLEVRSNSSASAAIDLQGTNYMVGGNATFSGNVELTSGNGTAINTTGDLVFQDDLILIGSGAVTMASNSLFVGGETQDPGSDSPMQITAQDINLIGRAGTTDALASLAANGTQFSADDILAKGSIDIAVAPGSAVQPVIDLNGENYVSTEAIRLQGPVRLNSEQFQTVLLQSGNDQAVTISETVSAADSNLLIDSSGDIQLQDVEITGGDLRLSIDQENNGVQTATLGAVTADNVFVDGSAMCDDLLILNGAIASVGLIQIQNVVDININNNMTTNGGDILLTACNSITMSAGTTLNSSDGRIVLTADANQNGTGDIEMTAGSLLDSGSGEILLSASGTIFTSGVTRATPPNGSTGDIHLTGQSIVVNSAVSTTDGVIRIASETDIRLTETGSIRSESGNISLIADALNASNAGEIFMDDLSSVESDTGTITLLADGNITVSSLETAAPDLAVTIESRQGGIIDGGDTRREITASNPGQRTHIFAATGVGSDNALEIDAHEIEIRNTTSGAIRIDEASAISTSGIHQTESGAIQLHAGNEIRLLADAEIAINNSAGANSTDGIQMQTVDGSIVLETAAAIRNNNSDSQSEIVVDANGSNSDVRLMDSAAVVQNGTATGNVRVEADDSIFLAENTSINVADGGNVELLANAPATAAGDSGNQIEMHETAVATTAAGTILVSTAGQNGGNVTLGLLRTENDTADAVRVHSNQAIIGGLAQNIDANSPVARTTLIAETGIGTGRAIQTNTPLLHAINGELDFPATGNIEINNAGNLTLEQITNLASGQMTGDTANGVVTISTTGDLLVSDNGDASATVHAENAIELFANDIIVDDDIRAVDDLPGTNGIDERIEIHARGNFDLLANRTVTTDDVPDSRFVTPSQTTADIVRISADADGDAVDANSDGVPDEGVVFVDATAQITTDGGVANLFAQRPQEKISGTAFFEVDSISVNDLQFVEVGPDGNVYQGLMTVKIGNPGEENLVLDIDWGDGRLIPEFANVADPDANGFFDVDLDSDKYRFLIPEGGREYVIPHRYTDTDISLNFASEPGRSEASDPIQVRFAVSQHVPSILVSGRVVIDPADVNRVEPIVIPTSENVAPLGQISSTNVVDDPPLLLPRFDNGVTEFVIPTRSVPRALLVKRETPIPEVQKISAPPETIISEETVFGEEVASSASGGGTGSEDFFQLRRRFPDGSVDVVIKRIDEVSGDQLFEAGAFDEFVADENLDDGSGYEIWLITTDPRGDVPVERPVFEFDVTAGKPGPAAEEIPDRFEELKLVPVDEDGVPIAPPDAEDEPTMDDTPDLPPGGFKSDDDDSDNSASRSNANELNKDRQKLPS